MRLLVDENTALQLMEPLRHLLRAHEVKHVSEIGWRGKKDQLLLGDAGRAGYEAFLTLDQAQLADPDECRAIRDSGMHHIRYEQRVQGLDGLALAIGAVIAAMPAVMTHLEDAGSSGSSASPAWTRHTGDTKRSTRLSTRHPTGQARAAAGRRDTARVDLVVQERPRLL